MNRTLDVSWMRERKRSVVLSTGLSLLLSLSLRTVNFVRAAVLSAPLGGTGRPEWAGAGHVPSARLARLRNPSRLDSAYLVRLTTVGTTLFHFREARQITPPTLPRPRRFLLRREARGKRGLAGTDVRPQTRKRPSGSFCAGAAPPTQPSFVRKFRFLPPSCRCSCCVLCSVSPRLGAPVRSGAWQPSGTRGRGKGSLTGRERKDRRMTGGVT